MIIVFDLSFSEKQGIKRGASKVIYIFTCSHVLVSWRARKFLWLRLFAKIYALEPDQVALRFIRSFIELINIRGIYRDASMVEKINSQCRFEQLLKLVHASHLPDTWCPLDRQIYARAGFSCFWWSGLPSFYLVRRRNVLHGDHTATYSLPKLKKPTTVSLWTIFIAENFYNYDLSKYVSNQNFVTQFFH